MWDLLALVPQHRVKHHDLFHAREAHLRENVGDRLVRKVSHWESATADLGVHERERRQETSQETILRFMRSFAFIGGAILPTSHVFRGRSVIDSIS